MAADPITNESVRRPYNADPEPCPACRANKGTCIPTHYCRKCKKCQLYGHIAFICRQKQIDGVAVIVASK